MFFLEPQKKNLNMKNTKQIIKTGFLLILITVIGCNNFEEINTNPDTATVASASMVCTEIILSQIKFNGRDAHAYLQPHAFAKYLGYANGGQMPSQYNYLYNGSFGPMTILPNIEILIQYSKGTPMEESYLGVAKFMRSFMFYDLTMKMGDIPYSDTNKGNKGEYRPKFDTQEDVFKGILKELKEADAHFSKGITFAGDPTPYNGNPDKWRRACNAFTLRVLMSLSKKANVASLDVKNNFASIVNSGNILQSNTGYLGLNYSTVNLHPMSGTNNQFTIKTVLSSLLINHLKTLNDNRIFYLADPATKEISAGKKENEMAAYVGVEASMEYNSMTTEYLKGNYSLLNSRYLKEAACEPRMMLTFAEQQLILAEARILGWISTSTAKEYYESGTKSALAAMMATPASYAHTKPITQAYIDGYFTGEAAFKSSEQEQLKQIWLQKYILNFMQDGETSFYEYRRTNFPVYPINPATNLNENNVNAMPVKWLYPTSETNFNRDNLIEALNRQFDGYDEINKIMWLLK